MIFFLLAGWLVAEEVDWGGGVCVDAWFIAWWSVVALLWRGVLLMAEGGRRLVKVVIGWAVLLGRLSFFHGSISFQ